MHVYTSECMHAFILTYIIYFDVQIFHQTAQIFWLCGLIGARIPSYNTAAAATPFAPPPHPPANDQHTSLGSYVILNFLFTWNKAENRFSYHVHVFKNSLE